MNSLLKTKIILFVLLAVGTFSCHTFIERYEKSGPDMLTDNWSLNAPESSTIESKENNENMLHLYSQDYDKNVNIRQDIPFLTQGSVLKLSADMKCENVQPGKKSWNLARLLLIQHDGKKPRWDLLHQVASLSGTRDWDCYNQFFTIGPGMEKIWVSAQLSHSIGAFRLKNIRLYPVKQTEIYNWIKTGVLVSWSLFFIFLLESCFFHGNRKTTLQVMLIFAFTAIIIGTTMPGDMKAQVTKQMENQVHKVHTANHAFEQIIPWDISKLGHFCFFVLFGLFFSMLLKNESVILHLNHILLLAGGTEIVQFYIDGRSPLILDFFIDAAGGFSGVLLTMVLLRVNQHPLS